MHQVAKTFEITGTALILLATCWQLFFEEPVSYVAQQSKQTVVEETLSAINLKLSYMSEYLEDIKVPDKNIDNLTEKWKLSKINRSIDKELDEFRGIKLPANYAYLKLTRALLFIVGSIALLISKIIESKEFTQKNLKNSN